MTAAVVTPMPVPRRILAVAGWAGLGMVALAVTMSDFLASTPVNAPHAGPILAAPSPEFLFGTDLVGRDLLSETLHALSVTATQGLQAVILAILAGGLLGYVCAHLPRLAGFAMRWVFAVLAAVPALLVAIVLVALTSRGFASAAAGLAAAPLAFVRAYDRARRSADSSYADFARATGLSPSMLLRRDLAYEFRDMFLSIAARAFASVTIILSTLSFLGFGATPPHRDLALMIGAARSSYLDAWWTAAFPALALVVLILLARLAAGLDEGERP
jgi:peptide/nickel transport system permease protein